MMKKEDNIRISFLGDLMCTIPMTQKAKHESGYDFSPVFDKIKDSLSSSDYVVGNLETPLAGEDCLFSFHPTEFNTPDEFVIAAYKAGINMMTTANNHSLDRGLYGLKRTIEVLDKTGIEHVGTQIRTDTNRTLYKTIDGIKFAFISYTYDTNSTWMNNKLNEDELYHINLFKEQDVFPYGGDGFKRSGIRYTIHSLIPDYIKDLVRDKSKVDCGSCNDFASDKNIWYEERLYEDIRIAKDKSDYVCLCLHIGGQYNDVIGVYTQKMVDKCKEVGANYIICNHPHCVLPITIDKEGALVAYALGNFCYTPQWGYYVEGKYSEYSVALHLLFNKESKMISDIRFSVLKSINNEVNTQVYNTFDLYHTERINGARNEIEKDIRAVLYRLLGVKLKSLAIKKEYSISEFL